MKSNRTKTILPWLLGWLLVVPVLFGLRVEASCPFCTALSGTISEEISEAKVAVLAKCRTYVPPKSERELHFGDFEILSAIKGEEHLLGKKEWIVSSIDPMKIGEVYWLVAFQCEPLEFGGPVLLSKIAQEYLKGLEALPEKGKMRLQYFLKYIELDDPVVADDAFNEFARATFSEVTELRETLDRDHVLKVLRSPKTSLSLRRLFWSFLSICGKPEDALLFDELREVAKKDPKFELGLEAAIACYISLQGTPGLKMIESRFLENKEASPSEVYLAILAIRVHGEEIGLLPKKELARSLAKVVTNIDFADQALPDLARWEEWSILPQLIELFRKVDEEHEYLRVPIIHFAMACPLPEAKEALKEFEAKAPDAVRRARTIFSILHPAK